MLEELLKKTRCYRRFYEDVKIEKRQLIKIVESLRYVSSARNAQPLKYIVSTDEDLNEKIFDSLRWAGYLADWDGPGKGERPSAYIVVIRDLSISKEDFSLIDAGMALQTIMLLLTEKGLGGCPIAAFDRARLNSLFGLSDNLEIVVVVAIGKPKERVVIVEAKGDIKYYRDDKGVHYVPKRPLSEILIKSF